MHLKSRGKVALKAAAATAVCVAVATPAFAEGYWSGEVNGVHTGFSSRTWVDTNRDSASNYAQISNCTRSASLAIYRNRQWPAPDEVVGSEAPTCNNAVYYKRTAGDIHFTVKKAGSTGGLYGDVYVGY